jgi:hypothetical protein
MANPASASVSVSVVSTDPSQSCARNVSDLRPRWRRMLGPVAALGALALATLYVRQVDPNVPGHYPGCPTQVFLGIDCPGCGGLRATHALTQGDIPAAADHNLLVVVLIPGAVILLGLWVWRAWRGVIIDPRGDSPRQALVRRHLPTVLVIVMLVFGVVRNFLPYLGSGIG